MRGLGEPALQAVPAIGLKERQLRNWVHRFGAEGLEGLRDRPRPGQPKHLPGDQEEAFQARVRHPPRGTILRGKDIHRLLKEDLHASYSLSGTYLLLHRLGFSSLSPRPVHPQTNPEVQADFGKTR